MLIAGCSMVSCSRGNICLSLSRRSRMDRRVTGSKTPVSSAMFQATVCIFARVDLSPQCTKMGHLGVNRRPVDDNFRCDMRWDQFSMILSDLCSVCYQPVSLHTIACSFMFQRTGSKSSMWSNHSFRDDRVESLESCVCILSGLDNCIVASISMFPHISGLLSLRTLGSDFFLAWTLMLPYIVGTFATKVETIICTDAQRDRALWPERYA